MQYLKKKTNKKFYNKYVYKIALFTDLARAIDLRITLALRDNLKYSFIDSKLRATSKNQVALNMATELTPFFASKECRRRVEGHHFNVFTTTKEDFDKILKITEKFVKEVHEPSSEEDLKFFENNSSKKILTDALPYGKYKYKIYMKYNMAQDKRVLVNKITTVHGKNIKLSKQTSEWLKFSQRWCWSPYMYVTDSSSLTMLTLMLGDNIKKIEEYVLRDELVTV